MANNARCQNGRGKLVLEYPPGLHIDDFRYYHFTLATNAFNVFNR
jgi:hypothetical protein